MKLPSEIQTALLQCADYSVERGKKHTKIFVSGRLVGVLPGHGFQDKFNVRATLNVRAQILRAAKGIFPRCHTSQN